MRTRAELEGPSFLARAVDCAALAANATDARRQHRRSPRRSRRRVRYCLVRAGDRASARDELAGAGARGRRVGDGYHARARARRTWRRARALAAGGVARLAGSSARRRARWAGGRVTRLATARSRSATPAAAGRRCAQPTTRATWPATPRAICRRGEARLEADRRAVAREPLTARSAHSTSSAGAVTGALDARRCAALRAARHGRTRRSAIGRERSTASRAAERPRSRRWSGVRTDAFGRRPRRRRPPDDDGAAGQGLAAVLGAECSLEARSRASRRRPGVRSPSACAASSSATAQITAVDGLDLDVPEGTCVGLLGPNGAGKSTTMRMLTAQAIADEGEIEVLGYALPGESKAARAQCGVVPQLDNLDVTLTVEQNLLVFAHLYRIGRARAPRGDRPRAGPRQPRATAATRRSTELSGGMRRRLLIARALVHRPRLLLLDEPTVGLDPQVRQELWALIDRLRSEGISILMSTHYIEEAERLADTVTIMSHGSAVAVGPPAELVAEHAGREAVEVYGPPARLRRGRGATRARGPAHAAHRHQRRGPRAQRPRPRRRAPPGQPGGRVRAAHRRGDRDDRRDRRALRALGA